MRELDWEDKRTIKFFEQGKEKGLILIGDSEKAGHKFYQFKKCKHTKEIALEKVRRGIFECKECIKEKHENEAKACGLNFIKHTRKAHALYQFHDCKHIEEKQLSHVRNNKISCVTCKEQRRKNEAEKAGLEIIAMGKHPSGSRIYRFLDCGHKKEIQLSQVRKNEVHCDICFKEKINNEAEKAGLEIIGDGKQRGSRKYKFKKCGHERYLDLRHVRQLSFICNKCVDGFRDLPSKIYLLKLSIKDFEWLKVGYSKDIAQRIYAYKLHEDVSVEIIKTIDYKDGHKAFEDESNLHTKLNKNKLKRKVVKKYMKSGNNECYPIEMKEILQEELANLGNK
jgi:hypothetical protein